MFAPFRNGDTRFAPFAFGPNTDPADISHKVGRCAAFLMDTNLVDTDGSEIRNWLGSSGVAGVRAQYENNKPTGFILAVVQDRYVALLRSRLGAHQGLGMLVPEGDGTQTYPFIMILPQNADPRAEFELLVAQLPEGASVTYVKGNVKIMDRSDSGFGISGTDPSWAYDFFKLAEFPRWSNGVQMCPISTGFLPKVGTFVALGVEGQGGLLALAHYLHMMLGVQVKITFENRSVDRLHMVNIEYPFDEKTEKAVHHLTSSSCVVDIDSSFAGSDKYYLVQFSPDAAQACFRAGTSVVKEVGQGNQQLALLGGAVTGLQAELAVILQEQRNTVVDANRLASAHQEQITQLQQIIIQSSGMPALVSGAAALPPPPAPTSLPVLAPPPAQPTLGVDQGAASPVALGPPAGATLGPAEEVELQDGKVAHFKQQLLEAELGLEQAKQAAAMQDDTTIETRERSPPVTPKPARGLAVRFETAGGEQPTRTASG